MVEFRLLGPVEVRADGRLIEAGEPRRRAVLAALLIDAGLVVASTTLIDRVWGDRPPAQVRNTLGTHVTRIRRVLASAAAGDTPVRVVSQSGGYQLVVDRDRIDVHRFRRLVGQARDPGRTDQQRMVLLRQALMLWRGEPLAGLSGDWAAQTREHLVRERLDATAAWADAELSAGDPAAVLAPLTELADAHPLMEPLTVALARALVAVGRPTEALERCRVHRRRLADEYGTDQDPALRTLYAAILRGAGNPPARAETALPAAAPALVTPALVTPGLVTPGLVAPAVVVPAQLPADAAWFAGRTEVLGRLDKLLAEAGEPPTRVVITALSGTAGVGKPNPGS